MDDHLQMIEAQHEGHEGSPDPAVIANRGMAVAYTSDTDSCTLYKIKPTTDTPTGTPFPDSMVAGNGSTESPAAMQSNGEYTTVLLKEARRKSRCQIVCPSCYNFFKSYRSVDHTSRITPFAVVLLFVLFVVYVLNQADRLVLPVVIPAGLRCELPGSDRCSANESDSSSGDGSGTINGTDDEGDCINFTDFQQGLLTGKHLNFI